MIISETKCDEMETDFEVSIKEECSQNNDLTKNYDLSSTSQPIKKENNTDMLNQNQVTPYSKNVYDSKKVEGCSTNLTKKALRSSIASAENPCKKVKNDFDSSKVNLDVFKYDVRVNLERFDQENTQKLDNFKQTLRTSKRFKTETNIPPFKDLNF